MKGRTKKYLLFMFGNWKIIEKDSVIMNNIRDIMETIVNSTEFSFVTGDHVIIMCLNSDLGFEDITDILQQFLTPHISTYFVMPKPRKLDYRLDKKLESHLFGPSHPSKKVKIHPKVAEELSKQLKQVMDTKVRKLKEVLLSPIKINSPLRPLTVDTVLDKIIDEGMESLTTEELDFLKKYNNI